MLDIADTPLGEGWIFWIGCSSKNHRPIREKPSMNRPEVIPSNIKIFKIYQNNRGFAEDDRPKFELFERKGTSANPRAS